MEVGMPVESLLAMKISWHGKGRGLKLKLLEHRVEDGKLKVTLLNVELEGPLGLELLQEGGLTPVYPMPRSDYLEIGRGAD